MYAERIANLKSSAIRDILKHMSRPGMIAFAGGSPAPELFPVAEIAVACEQVLSKYGPTALQYSITEGLVVLREKLVSKLAANGLGMSTDNVIITQGSQQALDLISKLFIDKDSLVFTENPSYLGALQAFRMFQARIAAIPSDSHGIDVEALRKQLRVERPKFLYIMPNFQNPTGVTYSLERRKALVAAAIEHDLLIVEDDPYGELIFEGERLPSLFALAKGKNVIYLSSFSKTIAPGFRVAYTAGDAEMLKKMVIAKQGSDLQTNTFGQYIVNEYLESGHYQTSIDVIRDTYRGRRDAMIAAMEQEFPSALAWNRPSGGMFLWVTLPTRWDAKEILERCLEQNVAFVPGQEFFPDGSGRNTLRMNFSSPSLGNIGEGVKRMGKVLKEIRG
ncbi:MAG: PLP-dependent aminotransferase family protein [Nitrospiraceae bacterium]|nr:PLP-dependent aminotransferase family protein [Nitrospiraceae bacterium]